MGPSWVVMKHLAEAAAATSSRDPGMASGSMTARQIRSHLGPNNKPFGPQKNLVTGIVS